MTLKEILQKYITLTTINLDKPIMLCADKKTFQYEYFTMGEGNTYRFVDEDTRKYLNEQFANKLPHIYFGDIDNAYMEENELDITAKVRLAIDRVAKYFSDVQDQNITVDKLENVKIKRTKADQQSTRAYYDANTNTIFFNEDISLMVLEHEFMHALSVNEDMCGLHRYIKSTNDGDGYILVNFGRAINEALTQHFVNSINNKIESAYSLYVLMLMRFLPKDKECFKEIKKAYLNSDLQTFIDTVREYKQLTNDEKVIEFIMNLDLLLHADYNDDKLINFDAVLANILHITDSVNEKSVVYSMKEFFKRFSTKLFVENVKDDNLNIVDMLTVATQLIHNLKVNGECSFVVPDEWKTNGFAFMLIMQSEFVSQNSSLHTNYAIFDYILNNDLITNENEEDFYNYVIMSNFITLSSLKERCKDKFNKLLKKYPSIANSIYLTDKHFLRYYYPSMYNKLEAENEQEKEN